jgi:hypothetical protein
VARYLSSRWIEEARAAAGADRALLDAARDVDLVVEQIVTGAPQDPGGVEGTVTYHVVLKDGTARLEAGVATDADVRFVQDYDTAVAVSTGALNAHSAFMTGRLRVTGNLERLIAAQQAFTALDTALAGVRARTTYA